MSAIVTSNAVRSMSASQLQDLQRRDQARDGFRSILVKGIPLVGALWLGARALLKQGVDPTLSWVLATAAALLMYVLLSEIEGAIAGRRPWIRYLAPLLVLITLSVAANLTVTYHQFVGPALLQEEIDFKRIQLESVRKQADSLQNVAQFNEKRAEVNGLLDKLISELNSPGRYGLGQRASSILDQLDSALQTQLVRHTSLGTKTPEAVLVLERRYRKDIGDALKRLEEGNPLSLQVGQAQQIAVGIDPLLSALNDAQAALRRKQADSEELSISAISQAVALLERADATFKQIGPKTGLRVRPVFENEGLGTLAHTLRSVPEHMGWLVTQLTVLLALAIDLFALLMVVVTTKSSTDRYAHIEISEEPQVPWRGGAAATAQPLRSSSLSIPVSRPPAATSSALAPSVAPAQPSRVRVVPAGCITELPY